MTSRELKNKLQEEADSDFKREKVLNKNCKRKIIKITLKDLKLLINCNKTGNYKPVFSTKLYNKYSYEYCRCLEFLNWEKEAI